MSPRWLFFPSPTAVSSRQDITYTLVNTGWTSMTVSNATGDAILTTSVVGWPPQAWQNATAANTKPRFVLGSYTSGYTSAQVATLWNSLEINYSINGGALTLLGSPVAISGIQPTYINSAYALNNASALGVGDTIRYILTDI